MTDATQPGVPAESETDTTAIAKQEADDSTKTANSQRVNELDDIGSRLEQQMLEENGIQPAAAETPPAEPAAADTQTPDPSPEPAPVELDPNAKVKIKVDGVEQVLPWGEAQKRLQLEEASRRRMDEAARLKKEAEAEREALAAERAASTQHPPKEPEQPMSRDKIRAALDAMYEGDSDKATEMFEELLQSGRTDATPSQQIDPERVAEIAAARLEERTALKQFAKDYQDIVADPYLADIADRNLDAVRAAEPNLPFADALQKAGTATRDWMKQVGLGATPATETPSRETKLQKKEALDQVPSLSVVPGSTPEAPNEEQDRRNGIQALMKARGQTG